MQPFTAFYQEKEALKFIEKNHGIVGTELYTTKTNDKKQKVISLSFIKEQTGTNIYVYYITCVFGRGKYKLLYELLSLNDELEEKIASL